MKPPDARRRAWLAAALAAGAWPVLARELLAAGPDLPPQGLRRAEGPVRVNGLPAGPGDAVLPGDTLETGPGGLAVFVVGRDAFLLRGESRLETAGGAGLELLRLLTGKVLSVLGGGRRRIETRTATIGVRGTGLYVEAEAGRTYVCTCYGTVDLQAGADPAARETVTTRHHDAPRYIHAAGAPRLIEKAPVINHSDEELILLESLVGREPPFVGPGYRQRY